MTVHMIKVDTPYFYAIVNNIKTWEGRLATEHYLNVHVGDIFYISDSNDPNRWIEKLVTDVEDYTTFKKMLIGRYWEFIPDADNLEQAIEAYYQFYTPEQEQLYGVIGFKLSEP